MKRKCVWILVLALVIGSLLACDQTGKTTVTLVDEGFLKDYYLNEAVCYDGLYLDIQKPGQEAVRIPVVPDMVRGADTSKEGEQTLYITYEGITNVIKITVGIAVLESIQLITKNFPLSYYLNADIDYTRLLLTLTFANGGKRTIGVTDEMYTPVNTTIAGIRILEVRYEGKSTQISITIYGDTDPDHFRFTRLDDGTYSIAALNSTALPGIIALPALHGGIVVSAIADNAFANSNSEWIDLGNTRIVTIGKGAFKNSRMTNVLLPDSILTMGEEAFMNCKQLEAFRIPRAIEVIPARAFSGCEALSDLVLPDRLTAVKEAAFAFCAMTEMPLDFVTEVGPGAFRACKQLTDLSFSFALEHLGWGAFAESGLISIVLPGKITVLEEGLFYACTSLKTVYIDGRITQIGDLVFYGCSALASISIPDSIAVIGQGAFGGCKAMMILFVPQSAVVQKHAFTEWEARQTIRFQGSDDSAFDEYWDYRCAAVIQWNQTR